MDARRLAAVGPLLSEPLMITNRDSGTAIDEIADGIGRISTPVSVAPGDLFTQGGTVHPVVTEADIPEPSEAFRAHLAYCQ